MSWPLRGEVSWSRSHSVEDIAQEMFASLLGHDKHHSLCPSFILFPSCLLLVGSAFCLLRSLSCFLLALPKSIPCLEMFSFLCSVTVYACVSLSVCLSVCVNVRHTIRSKSIVLFTYSCVMMHKLQTLKVTKDVFCLICVLKFAPEIVYWIFFSLL